MTSISGNVLKSLLLDSYSRFICIVNTDPWGLSNDMQMSIFNRKHCHASSHSIHFVRHEGRLAAIGRTQLTRSMAAKELGFYIPAAALVALAIAGCFQDGHPDGH